jgi:hypothetical protein
LSLIYTAMSIEIFKRNENPFNQSYEDHVKNYWKFICQLPKDKNPAIDNDGQKDEIANQNSNAPFFYLNFSKDGGSLVERKCRVPSEKGVFIPVMGVEVSEKEVQNSSVDQLKKIAKKDQDSVKDDLSLRLDGNEVNNLHSFRVPTDAFELNFPENALFDVSPGTSQAVADGFYIITKPLSPGTHTIEFKGSLENDDNENSIEPNYSVNVKYTLEVQ